MTTKTEDSNSTEESAGETLLNFDEQQELIKRGVVFTELMKSQRFVQFIQCNYDFASIVDDETKTITFQVMEVPPEEMMRRVAALRVQEEKANPQIKLATAADLKEIDEAARKAGVIQ